MGIITDLVINEFMELGECPYWDQEEQALYWVDMDMKRIHKYCPGTKKKEMLQMETIIGCIAKESKETLIAATGRGFCRVFLEDGNWEYLCNPEADKPGNFFNDGKCDRYGRFWAGTQSESEVENAGALYVFTSDGRCKKMLSNVTISNGLAWTEDYKKLYYIDTWAYNVTAYDYDLETGSISDPQIVLNLRGERGMPDGMTIDRSGHLWVAMWGGSCVLHCDPVTGRVVDRINLPVSNVTSCTFGGKDLDVLYITTAKAELTEEEKQQQPYAGGIFRVKMNVKGFPSNRFGMRNECF